VRGVEEGSSLGLFVVKAIRRWTVVRSNLHERIYLHSGCNDVRPGSGCTVGQSLWCTRLHCLAAGVGCDRASAKDFHEIRAVFTRGVA